MKKTKRSKTFLMFVDELSRMLAALETITKALKDKDDIANSAIWNGDGTEGLERLRWGTGSKEENVHTYHVEIRTSGRFVEMKLYEAETISKEGIKIKFSLDQLWGVG